MIKTITIGDKEVTFKSSAAIPHIYRRTFGRDVFVDMDHMQRSLKPKKDGTAEMSAESLDMLESLAWCFAKHADPAVPDDPEQWLEQFEMMDIYAVFPEVISMWSGENKSTSKLKKNPEKLTER